MFRSAPACCYRRTEGQQSGAPKPAKHPPVGLQFHQTAAVERPQPPNSSIFPRPWDFPPFSQTFHFPAPSSSPNTNIASTDSHKHCFTGLLFSAFCILVVDEFCFLLFILSPSRLCHRSHPALLTSFCAAAFSSPLSPAFHRCRTRKQDQNRSATPGRLRQSDRSRPPIPSQDFSDIRA